MKMKQFYETNQNGWNKLAKDLKILFIVLSFKSHPFKDPGRRMVLYCFKFIVREVTGCSGTQRPTNIIKGLINWHSVGEAPVPGTL